jgi:hypothetical protein
MPGILVTPDESIVASGGHDTQGPSSHIPSRSKMMDEIADACLKKFGDKVAIEIGASAQEKLERAANGTPMRYNAAFGAENGKSKILLGRNATWYDFWHETLHAEHFFELPESGRKAAWDLISEQLKEFEVIKRMRSGSKWHELSANAKAHGLVYARWHFERKGLSVPDELTNWIDEWTAHNKSGRSIESHYLDYMAGGTGL